MTAKIELTNLTLQEMQAFMKEQGYPAFRAKQIYRRLWHRNPGAQDTRAQGFQDLKEIPVSMRQALEEICTITWPKAQLCQKSQDGTHKYLFQVGGEGAVEGKEGSSQEDALSAERIEAVFMRYEYGNTLCVSSQAGCRMGCRFCASTRKGLSRGLTAGEMAGQLVAAERDRAKGESLDKDSLIDHVVVMGIGEPFDNFEELLRFIQLLHEPEGLNMSLRNITVSTCGLLERMEEFAELYPQVNLAISLHAPSDAIRQTIMPIAQKYSMDDLIPAARRIGKKTGRRITFEYALMAGVNDRDEDIRLLGNRLRGTLCHVNLIPLNEVAESEFKGVPRQRAMEIAETLTANGVPATVRRSLGTDIDAACGQLRLDRS